MTRFPIVGSSLPSPLLIKGHGELDKVLHGLSSLIYEKPSHCDDFLSFSS